MAENVVEFTMTNWITVFIMVVLGLVIVGIGIGIYTKLSGGGAKSGT